MLTVSKNVNFMSLLAFNNEITFSISLYIVYLCIIVVYIYIFLLYYLNILFGVDKIFCLLLYLFMSLIWTLKKEEEEQTACKKRKGEIYYLNKL